MKNPIESVNITPNTKLLASLRNNNLSNNEAVADLLDNAIDADVNAKNIYIIKNKDTFVMADDGAGMNRALLIDALKLGSAGREKPTITDLGLFGMGLKNAVLSLGRSTLIITKSEDDEFLTAGFDLDNILQSEIFSIPLYQSNEDEIKLFNDYTRNSPTGTAIIIKELDKVTFTTDGTFKNSIIKHLGEVFRIFIKDGLNIYVNDTLVKHMEPLGVDYATSIPVQLEDEQFTFETPSGALFNLRIKIALLPILLEKVSSEYKQNMTNQGFYIMRNDRQIKRATWLKFLTQHNNYNRIRGEIYFSGDVDDIFGVPFEKNSVKLQEWLFDKLKPIIVPKVNALRTRVESEAATLRQTSDQENIDFKQIAENIDKKANRISSLNNSKGKVKGDEGIKPSNSEVKVPHEKDPKATDEKLKRKLVEIDTAKIVGPYICSFEPLLDGRLKITFNIDHDFYQKFYLLQGLTTKDAFTKLLFALGRTIASMSNQTEEYGIMMDDFQRDLGETFRKLID